MIQVRNVLAHSLARQIPVPLLMIIFVLGNQLAVVLLGRDYCFVIIGWRRSYCRAVLQKVEKLEGPLCSRIEEEEETKWRKGPCLCVTLALF